jgi:hypothetical protein
MVIVNHQGRKAEVPLGGSRLLDSGVVAASARNLALTGPSCPGRKAAYEARLLGASLVRARAGKARRLPSDDQR